MGKSKLGILALAFFMVSGVASAFIKSRTVEGKLVDREHQIYLAECDKGEKVIGGSCQCHASGTWIVGISGNGWQCACERNQEHTRATAVCLSF